MNIFVLDYNFVKAAEYHNDKHVVKMILESVQLLTNAYYASLGIKSSKDIKEKEMSIIDLFKGFPRVKEDGTPKPYKITHMNHPCSKWVCEKFDNWYWLLMLAKSLCDQYKLRYNKTHACQEIVEWMENNWRGLKKDGFIDSLLVTDFPIVVSDECKTENVIESYRNYYMKEKRSVAKWSVVGQPDWWR
jgi:hypothetical protein